MKLSSDAMNAALRDFSTMEFATKKVSLYESLLTALWLRKHERYRDPTINDANEAIAELFTVLPDHPTGRLRAFRFRWQDPANSGRKTVWNNTTRGERLATSIFENDDIRWDLRPDAIAITQEALADDRLPSLSALAVLITRNHAYTGSETWDDVHKQLATQLGVELTDLEGITDARPLGVPPFGKKEWDESTIDDGLAPERTITVSTSAIPHRDQPDETTHVVLDVRTERMLLHAIQHAECILLAGPPGSGKGMLIRWLTERVTSDPTSLGFRAGFNPDPMWKTPDDSWSSFELTGGFVPDGRGVLSWSDGLLLDAIHEDRWLVLDETNRADLDKIMGPMMTWLSGQAVEVGRTAPQDGEPIHIGWADSPESEVTAEGELDRPTQFLAGMDWRLLGTYNPLDAQRVFRMGQALSRRFVIVPIPAIAPAQFEKLLTERSPELFDEAAEAISRLYAAHFEDPETLLGPAVFLRAAALLRSATEPDQGEIAEAYLLSVGKFVAGFDDRTFDALGDRVSEEDALPKSQWNWIKAQCRVLG